jgi:glycosyltransferase involved in cell wall biosynthesis
MHGPARYVQTLATELGKIGCVVHVVTAHPGPETDFKEGNYTVHTRRAKPWRFVSRFQPGIGESKRISTAIEHLVRLHNIDVVEFTNVEGVGFWYSKFGGRPSVIRVHTTSFDAIRLGIGNQRLEAGYARLERKTAKYAAALVTHTESHRLQAANDYGVMESQFALVPHGITVHSPHEPPSRHLHRIVSVGAATERKGVKDFLDIANLLTESHSSIEFVWAGKDSETAPGGLTWEAFALSDYPRLNGKLRFVKGLSDQELGMLYATSFCYLSTAKYESFGMTVVEAMMAGLPVIAPEVASFKELIDDRSNGLLYPADDLIAAAMLVSELINQPNLAKTIGENAVGYSIENFSAEAMANKMLKIYHGVVACQK